MNITSGAVLTLVSSIEGECRTIVAHSGATVTFDPHEAAIVHPRIEVQPKATITKVGGGTLTFAQVFANDGTVDLLDGVTEFKRSVSPTTANEACNPPPSMLICPILTVSAACLYLLHRC